MVPPARSRAGGTAAEGCGHHAVQWESHPRVIMGRKVQDRHPRNRRAGRPSLRVPRRTPRGVVRTVLRGAAV